MYKVYDVITLSKPAFNLVGAELLAYFAKRFIFFLSVLLVLLFGSIILCVKLFLQFGQVASIVSILSFLRLSKTNPGSMSPMKSFGFPQFRMWRLSA